MRQVTHALLTRPPLNCLKSIRKLHSNSSVRLACVKHAASVHPEPGSNSHVKMVFEPVKISLANLTVLTVLRFLFFISLKIFWNFQGCITVYLSRCFAVVLISFDILSQLISFVNNFFNFFELFQEFVSHFYAATVIYYNSLFSACQALFLNFFQSSVAFQLPQRLLILSEPFAFVKHFFLLFLKKFFAPHLLR